MIKTLIEVWPVVRRVLIGFGIANGLIAAMFWMNDINPIINGPLAFIGMIAFLVGAKAEDDPT